MVSRGFVGQRRSFHNRPNSFVPDGNQHVRVKRAQYHGPCTLCPFPILKNKSFVVLHFDSGTWVHVGCLNRASSE